MSKSNPSSNNVAPLTGFVLSCVVFLCLTLIGFSGYLKFQLDHAEMLLAAPESAFTPGDDAPEKLRRALGYSGFVSTAQNFLATRDHSAIAELNGEVKAAQDVVARLPEKTPPEARRDLQSIVDMFATAAHKAEQSTTDVSVGFTPADMAPLLAALPVLDARVESAIAAGRLGAQSELKLWAMLLMLVAWISLITAAACAAGIYLSLRGRHAAPLRALAQSVQNMARGDMRTPIWGMERQDMIGELARAVDLARYHFSQLPDLSLLSEQGPVRIRFEGQARSLFEAMMQNIARDSEGIREQASSLADSVSRQKESIGEVSKRIESALGNMYRERQSSEQQVQQLLQSVAGSAQTLHGAQESATAQLDHLIAYLEERARGMAEVTQIAGKQVAQTLQSLSHTELNLRVSAEQNQQTVQKLAASTDELGERLFGAVSLLRAGGKVLTETAEETQSRLNEAINLLSQSETSLRQMLVQGFEPVGRASLVSADNATNDRMERLQAVVGGLEVAQRKLEECLTHQAEATEAQIGLLTTHSNSLLTQASTAAQTLANVTNHLRDEQERLDTTIVQSGGRFTEVLENLGSRIEQRVSESLGRADASLQSLNRLSELSTHLGALVEKLSAKPEPAQAAPGEEAPDGLLTEIKTGFEVTVRSVERLREEFINMALRQSSSAPAAAATGSPAPASGPLPDMQIHWDRISAQIASTNENLARVIAQQTASIETRLAAMDKKMANANAAAVAPDEAQAQLKQQAQILSELAAALSAIDQHMQEMETMFREQSAGIRDQNIRERKTS